ncbi:DUF2933 domain-containing protein [Massilia arenosa]|uniref:DUF2933 domain-containing protein n=1 Tax=Zemynaea arenosa TaxID=2561931 RepID=A0A4Y9RWJ1_9BURK|nr:DUF2933 domain-containing protein [Massilia arenosa]TFW13342.1 DUF2933 domain-containing protein [Massilia arenosa]
MSRQHHPGVSSPWRQNWLLIAFLAVAAFYLFAEHRAHLLGVLPYLLLAACPLMHLFHHHGHGGYRKDADNTHEHGSP